MTKAIYKTPPIIKGKVDFNTEKCNDLVTIQNKLLDLAQQEKEILENFKNSDKTLGDQYGSIRGIILDEFGATIKILKTRQRVLFDAELATEKFNHRRQVICVDRHNAIDRRFELKLAKFRNRLHWAECRQKYRQEKQRLRDERRKNSGTAHQAPEKPTGKKSNARPP